MSIELANLSPERQEYYGGFLDDCINLNITKISRIDRNRPNGRLVTYYSPELENCDRDKKILEYLDQVIHLGIKPTDKSGYATFQWLTNDSLRILEILEDIEPYLGVVRPQSRSMIEFLEQRSTVRRRREGASFVKPTSEEREEQEEELYNHFNEVKATAVTTPYLPSIPRLAGMLDASFGSMGIYTTDGKKGPLYSARLALNSGYSAMLERIQQEHGGTFTDQVSDRNGSMWLVTGRDALILLQALEPHMVLYRSRARFLIDFLKVHQLYDQFPGRTKIGWEFKDDPVVRVQRLAVLESYTQGWQQLIQSGE